MDRHTPEQRRRNMQAIRSTGSKIEVILAKALFARGHRYRKNDKTIFGRPDLTFRRLKVAIFVDSEFWHGKNWEKEKLRHKSNVAYWHQKIERNMERDKLVNKTLRNDGWKVLRFWGKQVVKNLDGCISKAEQVINSRKEAQEA
jgi:DNA mismatch endonuclease Vsr